MATRIENWREKELSLEEVIAKYPDVSRFVILKTDVQRRGYLLSDAARALLDPKKHHVKARNIFLNREDANPVGLILRDGTSIVQSYAEETNWGIRDPYLVDVVDGKLVLTDEGRVYEEVEFWEKPDFFDKTTSKGTPMWHVLGARPQRLDLNLNHHCHFWDEPGGGCKYCVIGALSADEQKKNICQLIDHDDVAETLEEALKQEGRFTSICATSGSIITGKEPFEDEIDLYVAALSKIRPLFKTKHLHLQLVATAYNKRQLERLRDEAGVITYTSDLEVLNKDLFSWVCPGKNKYVGYEKWKQSLYDAVEVFGKGNVNTGIVGGVELAKPNGFESEEEALKATLAEAEELGKHGVSVINCVWNVGENTIFKNQVPASLDYYVALAKGLNDIREAHGIDVYFDDYRRCGNHPNTDLARI